MNKHDLEFLRLTSQLTHQRWLAAVTEVETGRRPQPEGDGDWSARLPEFRPMVEAEGAYMRAAKMFHGRSE